MTNKLLLSFIFFLFFLTVPAYSLSLENKGKPSLIDSKVLNNFSYHLIFGDRIVHLKDGKYRSGSNPGDLVSAELAKYTIADINNDGVNDAVVVLVHNGAGSGTFYELTALIVQNGRIKQTNSVMLGDRIKINELHLTAPGIMPFDSDIEILLKITTHKDDDPSCCPTKEELKCFVIEGSELTNCYEKPIVKKPVIYLYPTKKTEVTVNINPKGKIIKSDPEYNKKWKVEAIPDGTIKVNYDKYKYLFYEIDLSSPLQLSKDGWVVAYKDLEKWFDEYLIKLGLNNTEKNDFKEYWLKDLKPANFYEIKLLEKDFIDKNMEVEIIPAPDVFLRVILHFQPLNEYKKLNDPIIKVQERKGFVAVEWGGISDKE